MAEIAGLGCPGGFMALDARLYGNLLLFPKNLPLRDMTMTGFAFGPSAQMVTMLEEDVVGKLINPDPGN